MSSVAIGVKAKTMDLGVQCTLIQHSVCSTVQRWWSSRCCFITPYVATTNPLSTSLWQLLSASRIWSVLIDACGHSSNSFQIFKQKCLPRMLFSAYGLDYQLNERDFLLVEMLDTDVKSQLCSQGL